MSSALSLCSGAWGGALGGSPASNGSPIHTALAVFLRQPQAEDLRVALGPVLRAHKACRPAKIHAYYLLTSMATELLPEGQRDTKTDEERLLDGAATSASRENEVMSAWYHQSPGGHPGADRAPTAPGFA